MNPVDQAVSSFEKGFNCSQSVFSAYSPSLDEEIALRIGAPFGGGMGLSGGTCGAVSGALMALGLHVGSTEPSSAAREGTYRLASQFLDRFEARNGTILCRELLGCDINTAEGLEVARKKGLFETRCPMFVRDAAEIVGELLTEVE